MADPKLVDIQGAIKPTLDGDVNYYRYKEALASTQFNNGRRVIFINGMDNTPAGHVKSALALSWVQMCTVVGVYNKSAGQVEDFAQCFGDKNQFDGPFAASARAKVAIGRVFRGQTKEDAVRSALKRNKCQVKLFNLLRESKNRLVEIFAHSQGNLILSNTLQAIAAVDGSKALIGRKIHTFGSPAVNWPARITRYEHGFTWDPITFLAGFDSTWTISKVGMPKGSLNPITHGFLEYLERDPSFVVNRYRVGGLGVTFSMDEEGLAEALAAMGRNTSRVLAIFEHLNKEHNSDADDVAVRYVAQAMKSAATKDAIKKSPPLVALLIRILDEGWTDAMEKQAITDLQLL